MPSDAEALASLVAYSINDGDPDWDGRMQRLAARLAAVAEALQAGAASDISPDTPRVARLMEREMRKLVPGFADSD